MDPVGPWSYSYNRLASAPSATPSSGDFHHHLATIAAANAIGGIGVSSTGNNSNTSTGAHHSTTGLTVHPAASQLLLQSGFSSNFLTSTQNSTTPSNIAYETVFSPFLTHAQHSNPKPAHFNNLQTTTQRNRTENYQQNSQSPSQHQQITNLSQQQQQSPQNSRRFVSI
jgi:hypothetical protein